MCSFYLYRPRQVISAINIPLSVMLGPVLACRLVSPAYINPNTLFNMSFHDRFLIFVSAAPRLSLIQREQGLLLSQRSR